MCLLPGANCRRPFTLCNLPAKLHMCPLQEALLRVCSALAHYSSTRVLDETEQSLVVGACKMAKTVLCPYLAACYRRLYGAAAAASLDLAAATRPLQDVLEPAVEQQESPAAPPVTKSPDQKGSLQQHAGANNDAAGDSNSDVTPQPSSQAAPS